MNRYSKSIIAAIGLLAVVLTSLQGAWGDTVPQWVPIVTAVVTALSVYFKPNAPEE